MERCIKSPCMKVAYLTYNCIYCIFDTNILHIMHIIFVSELDGDQLVDFYWIDPVMVAERLESRNMLESYILNLRQRTRGLGLVSARLVVSMEGLYLRLPISWTKEVSP